MPIKDEQNKENRLLIFMHIPKTGGSTLRSIIDKQYPANQILNHPNKIPTFDKLVKKIPENQLNKIKCIKGHYPFGIHKHFDRPFNYITLLREPVERVLSLFYYIKSEPSHPVYTVIKDLNLEDFLDLDEEFINSRNELYQLRKENTQTFYACGQYPPDLQLAVDNLSHYFSVVGITERFAETLALLKDNLNWKDTDYTKLLVNQRRPSSSKIPDRIINKIKEQNQLDLKLYDWARKGFEQKVIYNA